MVALLRNSGRASYPCFALCFSTVHEHLNKECLCLYFVAAADTIADRSFQIVCRDEISGMGFQNRFLKGKQLWLDVVHLAF